MYKLHTRAWSTIAALTLLLAGCARSPEARRDRFLARGKDFVEKRDYSRAILEFQNAAQVMPKDADTYYQMGVASALSGDLRTAIVALRRSLELNPKHADAQLRLAQLMTGGDKDLLEQAEESLTELIATNPATSEMLTTLAFTRLRLGNADSAIKTLEQVLSSAPREMNSAVLLARAHIARNDVAGAEAVLLKSVQAMPDSPNPRIVLGRFYLSQKKLTEAEASFQKALTLDPESEAARMDLAAIQKTSGRKKEAEENFKRLSAKDGDYQSVYGLHLFSEGRRDEAIKEFERIVSERPNDRVARTRLLAAYGATNRRADVERILDEALKKNPNDLEALQQKGELSLRAGKYPEAEAALNQVIQLKPDSAEAIYLLAKLHQARGSNLRYKETLGRALQQNPLLLHVRLELAQVQVAQKEAKAALELLNAAPDFQRESVAIAAQRNWTLWALGEMAEMRKGIDAGLRTKRLPEFLIQDGLWKLRSGNASGARAALEEALQVNPGDLRALSGLKDSYLVQKQAAAAVTKVKEYAAQRPNSAPVQEFLGYMLWGSGDKAAARAAFSQAKSVEPRFTKADLSLVQLDVMDHKWDDAAARLTAVLAANPAETTARLWLGNIESARGNYASALEHFRKVVEARPDHPQALNNFAYLLAEHAKNPDEALKYAEKAQELAPGNATYADTLGWIYYRKGLYPSAVRQLERAASGKDAVSNYHLAMAYAKSGDNRRSRVAYDHAYKAAPNVPEARMAREILGLP